MASIQKSGENTVMDALEMDEDYDDTIPDSPTDSSSGLDSIPQSSASTYLSPFTFYNGRRYHSDRFTNASYFMPNDEVEQERLDLYHHVFVMMNGGNLTSIPFEGKAPSRVLDVGTGTGIWAIDFASEFPDSIIIGNDLSPIQPLWVPPNVTFEVTDVEEHWNLFYQPNSFDLIHMRTLSGSIKDWDTLLTEALKHAKPGGYVEFQDYGCVLHHCDGKVPETMKLFEYMNLCCDIADKVGRSLKVAKSMKERMIRLGYEDVTEKVQIWPVGPWPRDKFLKELGRFGNLCVTESLEAFSLELLTRYAGWSQEDVKTYCSTVAEDMKLKGTRGLYFEVFFVHGRKPLNPTTPVPL